MCTVCGCDEGEAIIEGGHHHPRHPYRPRSVPHHAGESQGGHDLHFGAGPAGAHAPGLSQARMARIEQDILAKNDACAAAYRRRFAQVGLFCIHLVSSPGPGKTTPLVHTGERLAPAAGVTRAGAAQSSRS
jgi:hydrogenase nickel incorporation protein HypB